MVDRTLMQYFLCLTSRMVNHLICVVIPYLCCDIIMVWYIVELHGLTPLSEVPHSAIYETRLGDMNGFLLFHVVLSDGVADPPFPTLPNTFTRIFFTKTSLPKQDPILPEMEFLLVTKTCTHFVVEQVQDEIVRSFVSIILRWLYRSMIPIKML